jgi:alpha-tubulin suppressor-like RCC1 family protein
VAVPGGLHFASINAGGYDHSCGVSTARIAYCWGGDWAGQLGDGTTNDSNVPVRVAGQP